MKIKLLLLALVLMAKVVTMPQSVSASANTKVDLVEDVAPKGVGGYDMVGPTYNNDCGYVNIADLKTNNQGNGNTTMMLSASSLTPGSYTDHIDLMKDVGNVSAGAYVASGINYELP